jgi:hypothetical protein
MQMNRYEITVTPVQQPERRITVDTINAVDVYLAGDVHPFTRHVMCNALREGDRSIGFTCFDVSARVRVVEEQRQPVDIPRRDYGAFAEYPDTIADELVKVAA